MKNGRCPKLQNFIFVLAIASSPILHAAVNPDKAHWQHEAQNVTIIRDDWGIAHIYGKTDADAVFGMEYAQAEDDFNRVETNYINAMGRLAEAEGESKIYQDLRMKLFIDPAALKNPVRRQPRLATNLDERLRRRPELLPLQDIPR